MARTSTSPSPPRHWLGRILDPPLILKILVANGVLAYLTIRPLREIEPVRARDVKLAARLVDAEERERKRIADDLVGDTAQLLSAALLQIEVASRRLESEAEGCSNPGGARQALEAARDGLQIALTGVQRLARDLQRPGLDEH